MELVRTLAERLALPGMPGWTGQVVLVLASLVLLAWVLMPFSVFGLKSRLDMLEVQLEEIQAEIRALAMRLAEQPRSPTPTDYVELPAPRRDAAPEPRREAPVPPPPVRPEPRLDWPAKR